jgi:hypothetical protein
VRDVPRRVAVGLVLAAVIAAGCGLADTSGGGNPSQPVGTASGTASGAPQQRRSIIAWIVGLGPGTPAGPNARDELNIYQDLQARRCESRLGNTFRGAADELDGLKDVYIGAIAACMAALKGGTNTGPKKDPKKDWAFAEHVLDAGPKIEDCLAGAVKQLLERLVAAHRKDPGAQLLASDAATASAMPSCPQVTSKTPASAHLGDTMVLTGRNLLRVESVNIVSNERDWGDNPYYLPVGDHSDRSISFTLPAEVSDEHPNPLPTGKVRIVLADRDVHWIYTFQCTIEPPR